MSESKYFFIGGHPAIDLANTVVFRGGGEFDLLTSPADYLDWTQALGLLTEQQAQALRRKLKQSELVRNYEALRHFRDFLRVLMGTLTVPEAAQTLDSLLPELNGFISGGGFYKSIEREAGELVRAPRIELERPGALCAYLANEFADFLMHAKQERFKSCGNENCILSFYDSTKNGKRRWHSMDTCGNREKVSRHRVKMRE